MSLFYRNNVHQLEIHNLEENYSLQGPYIMKNLENYLKLIWKVYIILILKTLPPPTPQKMWSRAITPLLVFLYCVSSYFHNVYYIVFIYCILKWVYRVFETVHFSSIYVFLSCCFMIFFLMHINWYNFRCLTIYLYKVRNIYIFFGNWLN
jgi:hypothetical protein